MLDFLQKGGRTTFVFIRVLNCAVGPSLQKQALQFTFHVLIQGQHYEGPHICCVFKTISLDWGNEDENISNVVCPSAVVKKWISLVCLQTGINLSVELFLCT